MKRLFLSIIICLFGSSVLLAGQQAGTDSTFVNTNAVSTHSFTLQILGLDYSYEQRLGGDFSMVFRAGVMTNDFYIFSSPEQGQAISVNLAAGLVIEPRYYTNFNRRARLGKSTYKNSADFVALRISGAIFDGYQAVNRISITPMYGIRRVWGKHWFGEFTAGASLHYVGYFAPGLHIQYRLGFVF